jgi:hypothetical protein
LLERSNFFLKISIATLLCIYNIKKVFVKPAAHEKFFVTNDEKYQKCLIFGLHVTNDENAVNVARTRGNFVDPLVTNDKYARQVRSCAAGFTLSIAKYRVPTQTNGCRLPVCMNNIMTN